MFMQWESQLAEKHRRSKQIAPSTFIRLWQKGPSSSQWSCNKAVVVANPESQSSVSSSQSAANQIKPFHFVKLWHVTFSLYISSAKKTFGEQPHQSTTGLVWHWQPRRRFQFVFRRLLLTNDSHSSLFCSTVWKKDCTKKNSVILYEIKNTSRPHLDFVKILGFEVVRRTPTPVHDVLVLALATQFSLPVGDA